MKSSFICKLLVNRIVVFREQFDKTKKEDRPILVYANFSPRSNKIRPKLLESFKGLATTADKNAANLEGYFSALTKSKFVLSPPGNELCKVERFVEKQRQKQPI